MASKLFKAGSGLTVGDRSWIGEDVWLHNQDTLEIGSDAVISQQTFVTTGTQACRDDMAMTTSPVVIGHGALVTARCVVLAGSHIGTSPLILPNAVVTGQVPDGAMYGPPGSTVVGRRFARSAEAATAPTGDGPGWSGTLGRVPRGPGPGPLGLASAGRRDVSALGDQLIG